MRVSFIVVINENETCVGKSKKLKKKKFFSRFTLERDPQVFLGMLVFVRSVDFVLFISANSREDK